MFGMFAKMISNGKKNKQEKLITRFMRILGSEKAKKKVKLQ